MPADETVAIAHVRLARDLRRLLLVPALLWLLGAAAIAAALIWLDVPLRLAGVGAGAVLVVIGAWLAIVPLTLRMQVEVGAIRVRSIAGERAYALVRGSVTRVTLRGPNAARMRARLGPLSRGLGSATLRDDERIELVRMAPTASAILVPTDHGRLLVAPALEQELLNALAAAARVQARLDQVAERTRALVARVPSGDPEAAAAAADRAAAEIEDRFVTGIERQLVEQRLASERAAALAAAEAERAAALAAAQHAADEAAALEAARAAAAAAEPEARRGLRMPAWRRGGAATEMAASTAIPVERPRPVPAPGHRRNRRARTTVTAPPGTGILIVLTMVPLVAAFIGWVAFGFLGSTRGPLAGPLVAGLILVGPLASLGVLMARHWWPRLASLVAFTAVMALVLVGWSLTGGPN